MLVATIVLAVVVVIAGALLGIRFMRRAVQQMARAALDPVADDPEVAGAVLSAAANLPGGQRGSGGATGGLGVLALLPDQVRFVLSIPRRTVSIPRAAITSATVETALKVPGRYRRGGPPFLVVRWSVDGGAEQVVGFQTTSAEQFRAALAD